MKHFYETIRSYFQRSRKQTFNLFVLIFFITNLSLTAQISQTSNTTVIEAIQDRFSLLELNRVPHNILLDYGLDFTDISPYNGILQNENFTSRTIYLEAYNTLVSSITQASVAGIESPIDENEEWRTLQTQQNNAFKTTNTVSLVLSGLYFNYSKIREDALATNRIQVTNGSSNNNNNGPFDLLNPLPTLDVALKYDDVYTNGVWQNPYETRTAFIISAPTQIFYRPNISVSLPSTLWHTNEAITNIEVDLGNGQGYQSLLNNATASTTYTSTGIHTWTYRVRLSNGQYRFSRHNVDIKVAASNQTTSSANLGNECDGVNDQGFRTLDNPIFASRPFQGVFGSATLQIDYANNQCELQKPLIVVEGLDTGLQSDGGRIGDRDIISFINDINASDSDELQRLITTGIANDDPFDIVYVNWNNGTDFIQRNAFVLQAVINYVNNTKTTNIPNVVLGQSMGGIVARYALRDMENRNEDHDTSLYISHDAPHQGANVPLGIQYGARHIFDFAEVDLLFGNLSIDMFAGEMFDLNSFSNLIDSPAARQLLTTYVDANFNIDNSLHESLQNELRSLGYPEQTRNIAISNGSHCGSLQSVSPGERMLNINGEVRPSTLSTIALTLLGNLSFGLTNLASGIILSELVQSTGGTALEVILAGLVGFLPGSTRLEADFSINAAPNSGTNQSYFGRLRIQKRLLFLVPVNFNLTLEQFNSLSNSFPFDSFPGGSNIFENDFEGLSLSEDLDVEFDIDIEEIDLDATITISNVGSFDLVIEANPNFNFIPVVSALDVGGSNNFDLIRADYTDIYTIASPSSFARQAIPFDNYTTTFNTLSANEDHITFNQLNGDWLAAELNNNSEVFDCSFICANGGISGPGLICSSASYSIGDASSSVNWSLSPSNAGTITGNGTNQISISRAPGVNSTAILTATINSPICGSTTVTRNIRFGSPTGTITVTGDDELNPIITDAADFFVNTSNVQGASSINFSVISFVFPNAGQYFTITGTSVRAANDTPPGEYFFTATASNACGPGVTGQAAFQVNEPGPDQFFFGINNDNNSDSFSVFPNPTSSMVNITENSLLNSNTIQSVSFGEENINASSTNDIIELRVYDFSGNVVLQKRNDNMKTMNLSGLKRGIYFLQIITNGVREMHKIVVK